MHHHGNLAPQQKKNAKIIKPLTDASGDAPRRQLLPERTAPTPKRRTQRVPNHQEISQLPPLRHRNQRLHYAGRCQAIRARSAAVRSPGCANRENLTRSISLQIILEEESGGVPMFSADMLANIIRYYGHSMQGLMGTYLSAASPHSTRRNANFRSKRRRWWAISANPRAAACPARKTDTWTGPASLGQSDAKCWRAVPGMMGEYLEKERVQRHRHAGRIAQASHADVLHVSYNPMAAGAGRTGCGAGGEGEGERQAESLSVFPGNAKRSQQTVEPLLSPQLFSH